MTERNIIYIIIGIILVCTFIGIIISPRTPMEYAKENNMQFNGTHYISNIDNDGFNRVCLKHPDFKVQPTSCKWMKIIN